MNRILLTKGEILTMASREGEPTMIGWVGVEGGRISLVTYDESEAQAWSSAAPCEEVDCEGMILLPGLINTHTHVSMTLMRNYADDKELMEWLTKHIWPFEALQSDDDITAGARLGIAEMMLSGTTTFVDMYWREAAIARAVEELGVRALLTECVVDGRQESFLEGMESLLEVAERCSRVMAGVGPHAPYTCSQETLKVAVEYAAKRELPLTIHLSETEFERTMMAERASLSPLEYLESAGALTPRTILAHSIYLNSEEIQRIAESGASVAHNAQSNMKLASGVAPIVEMCERGVNCTIATDSASSNNDLDMWEEMRTASLLQRVTLRKADVMKPYEVLWMATRGGAKAIGMESELGSIEVGKRADIVVIDGTKPHLRPRQEPYSALLYCAKGADVRDLFIDGVQRVRSGAIVSESGEPLDLESLISDVEQRRADILTRI